MSTDLGQLASEIKKQESEQKKQERKEMLEKYGIPGLIPKAIDSYKAYKKAEPGNDKREAAIKHALRVSGLDRKSSSHMDRVWEKLADIDRCKRSIHDQYQQAFYNLERYSKGLPDERDPSRGDVERLCEIAEWLKGIGALAGGIERLLDHTEPLVEALLEAEKNRIGMPDPPTVERVKRPAQGIVVDSRFDPMKG